MNARESLLVAKVTKHKSRASDRFQCMDVFQLWDSGEVTVDHCLEDEEWGEVDESRDLVDGTGLPEGFFKTGMNRVIDKGGRITEETAL
jgi:hypothetical protein